MISEGEWISIRRLIQRMGSRRGEEVYTGYVIKADQNKKLVYLREFGTQAIPMVGQDFEVTYYDTQYKLVGSTLKATTVKKTAKITQMVPKVGSSAVVLRELGTGRLPRCLGRLIGSGWIQTGTD